MGIKHYDECEDQASQLCCICDEISEKQFQDSTDIQIDFILYEVKSL